MKILIVGILFSPYSFFITAIQYRLIKLQVDVYSCALNNQLSMENQKEILLVPQQYYFPFIVFPEYWKSFEQPLQTIQLQEESSSNIIENDKLSKLTECKVETKINSCQQPQKPLKFKKGNNIRILQKTEKQEYKPYERRGRRKTVVLKQNRNVMPIKIRQMLSFLGREAKSLQILKKFFEKHNIGADHSEKRFYAFVKIKKDRVGNHVKLDVLKDFLGVQTAYEDIYSIEQQRFYLKLIRVMFKFFLEHIATLCTLNSNRIHSCQKVQHLKIQRQLSEFLQYEHIL